MSRATSDLMDMLHGLAAETLVDELARAKLAAAQPRTIMVDGAEVPNPAYAPLNPQVIDKALKMLKDNGIDAPKGSPKIDSLAAQLQDLDLDDTAARLQ
jgi:hypothetical protein